MQYPTKLCYQLESFKEISSFFLFVAVSNSFITVISVYLMIFITVNFVYLALKCVTEYNNHSPGMSVSGDLKVPRKFSNSAKEVFGSVAVHALYRVQVPAIQIRTFCII